MKVAFYIVFVVVCLFVVLGVTALYSTVSLGGSGSETPNVLNYEKKNSQFTDNDSAELPQGGLPVKHGMDTIEIIRRHNSTPEYNLK